MAARLDPDDLRAYARRDWAAPERLARHDRAMLAVAERVRIAIALYEAARATNPSWPDAATRRADFESHVRVKELLDRAVPCRRSVRARGTPRRSRRRGRAWFLFGAQAIAVRAVPRATRDVEVTIDASRNPLTALVPRLEAAGIFHRYPELAERLLRTSAVVPMIHRARVPISTGTGLRDLSSAEMDRPRWSLRGGGRSVRATEEVSDASLAGRYGAFGMCAVPSTWMRSNAQ